MPSGYVFFYNDIEITGTAFRTANGYSYPMNWCSLSTTEDLKKIGVVSLLQVWPFLKENNYYTGSFVDDFDSMTRTYEQSIII